MEMTRRIIVLDAADLEAVSTFWAGLLDGTVERQDDDWHRVLIDGDWEFCVQLAPDHVPPQWPDGQPQQVHLDLYPTDLEAAHAKALELGATLLQTQDVDPNGRGGFRVYADPAGHPFCLCWEGSPGE